MLFGREIRGFGGENDFCCTLKLFCVNVCLSQPIIHFIGKPFVLKNKKKITQLSVKIKCVILNVFEVIFFFE